MWLPLGENVGKYPIYTAMCVVVIMKEFKYGHMAGFVLEFY